MTLAGLLQTIREESDADAPRLVCADWYEEQGQPERGQLVRLQVELAHLAHARRGPAEAHRRDMLAARVQTLLDEHYRAWLGPLWGWNVCPEFTRGFIEEVDVRAENFLRAPEAVFKLHPIHCLHLRAAGEVLPAVLSRPELTLLTDLDLCGNDLDDSAVVLLAGSPHLARLHRLVLSGNPCGAVGARALAGSPWLGNLKRLSLSTAILPGESLRLLRERFGAALSW